MEQEKIVKFHVYCPLCDYKDLMETLEPCNECLSHPTNTNSCLPVNFQRKNSTIKEILETVEEG